MVGVGISGISKISRKTKNIIDIYIVNITTKKSEIIVCSRLIMYTL